MFLLSKVTLLTALSLHFSIAASRHVLIETGQTVGVQENIGKFVAIMSHTLKMCPSVTQTLILGGSSNLQKAHASGL